MSKVNTDTDSSSDQSIDTSTWLIVPPDEPQDHISPADADLSLFCLLVIIVIAVTVVVLGRHS